MIKSILTATTPLDSLAGIVILAGGASRRMGTPKAKLVLPTKETLLDYHIRQAIKLNVPIMIADNGLDFTVDAELLATNPELPIFHIADYQSTAIVDNSETEGPLVAIESALQALSKQPLDKQLLVNSIDAEDLQYKQSSWLMVISCDSLITAYDLWQELNPYLDETAEDMATIHTSVQSNIHQLDKSVICLADESHLYPLLGIYRLSVEPDLRVYLDSGQRQVMAFIEPIVQAVPVIKEWLPLTNFNIPEEFKHACAALYDL